MNRRFILCDIDHTTSNAFHRDEMIGGEGGWDAYHTASIHDEPLHDICEMLRTLSSRHYVIVGLTARPEKWRKLTMEWLIRHKVPMDELLMRPDDVFAPAHELKPQLACARFPDIQNQVAFLLEDRDDVTERFRALGITVLQVHGRQK